MTDQQNIFDENLINTRKKRIVNKFSTFLHDLAIRDLKDRLLEIGDEFLETLIVGPFAKHWAEKIFQKKVSCIDDEQLLKICPKSRDLIISAMHIHSANDPISKLVQMRFGLKKKWYFSWLCLWGTKSIRIKEII